MFLRAAVIIVLGLIAYGSMLPAPFRVMDDRISIVENPTIKSVKNIPAVFKEGFFHDQSYYRPLINLSFMGEYHFFKVNSFFYNLDNLILHILNALLVVLLVSRLTGDCALGFWTGLLFVIHPVQWEAVCNVPGRAILLSSFFELSSFVLFLEYYKRRQWLCLPLVLVTFFLSLLCKESAGMLPMIILGYLLVDHKKPLYPKLASLWPFVVGVIAYVALRKYFGITDIHHPGNPGMMLLGFVTFLRSVITDLRLFVLPLDLHYDRCLAFMMSLHQPQALCTIAFWAFGLILIAFNYRRIDAFVLFLIAWFWLELLPVSQLVASIGVGVGHISAAEHFLYLASIPVLIGILMAYRWIFESNEKNKFVQPVFLKFLAGGFLAFLLLTAIEQSVYAANEYGMIVRSLYFEPNNPRVQGEMAMLSVFRGDIPDAQKHFRLAIKAEPNNPAYHIALGTALCQQGRWIEGLEQFVVFDPGKNKDLVERQEKLTMEHLHQQLNSGKTFDARGWLAMGIYEAEHGEAKEAISSFGRTINLDPDQPDAWFNLGSLFEAGHQFSSAKIAYQKLLTLPRITLFQKDFATDHLKTLEKF